MSDLPRIAPTPSASVPPVRPMRRPGREPERRQERKKRERKEERDPDPPHIEQGPAADEDSSDRAGHEELDPRTEVEEEPSTGGSIDLRV